MGNRGYRAEFDDPAVGRIVCVFADSLRALQHFVALALVFCSAGTRVLFFGTGSDEVIDRKPVPSKPKAMKKAVGGK